MNIEASCMCQFLKEMLKKGIKVYPIYDSVLGAVSNKKLISDSFVKAFTINGISPGIHYV